MKKFLFGILKFIQNVLALTKSFFDFSGPIETSFKDVLKKKVSKNIDIKIAFIDDLPPNCVRMITPAGIH